MIIDRDNTSPSDDDFWPGQDDSDPVYDPATRRWSNEEPFDLDRDQPFPTFDDLRNQT
jgi:hypothetical protein